MKRDNRLNDERGFALLLSLLVVLLLTVLILEIDDQARADLRAAGNFRDDLNAFYLARSGISAGEAILKEDLKNSNSKYDDLVKLGFWNSFLTQAYPLGEGVLSGGITDESGKFNLNFLVDANGKIQQARYRWLQRLFILLQRNYPQIDPRLVDPIVDWIDRDTVPMPLGAEDEIYRNLDPPYATKANARFDTLEELRLVKGITDEVYQTILRCNCITVYGNGKINVNTAPSSVLQSLDEAITESDAGRLVNNRPYESAQKFKEKLPSADVRNRIDGSSIDVRSNVFSITATGQVQNTKKIIRAVVQRGSPTELLYFRVD